jgi:hypothetical protein
VVHPERWPYWPVLPLVRRRDGAEPELGLLYDLRGACGLCGYGSTVFRGNLCFPPATLRELLALPKEVFDSPEELLAAGWRVD